MSEFEKYFYDDYRFFGGPLDGKIFSFPTKKFNRYAFTSNIVNGELQMTKTLYALTGGENIYVVAETTPTTPEEMETLR